MLTTKDEQCMVFSDSLWQNVISVRDKDSTYSEHVVVESALAEAENCCGRRTRMVQ
jgi:hypothetical protein